jgi:ABC-2 type transport system permease protein
VPPSVVVGYVFNAVGPQSPDVEWPLNLSPYRWTYGNSPMANGWAAAGWLWVMPALLTAVSAVALHRRDIGA